MTTKIRALLQLEKLVKAHAKTIAAVLTPALTFVVTHYGLNLSQDTIALIVTVLTGGTVYAVPNTTPKAGA